ncbi:uncharacterized protein BO80DRAFT_441959 [Aspergillus ibericus CBS 121593]|uniref:Uncharacterized protein n=1 Tax=Aspergillus ibericus CBS 121593 TaxID=1448316 RepID=A0A395HE39_9EURO|nr:hypothetical protein BO80DRAFT_441959 [Aspergillus ibericus CBS 121593]RAL04494.1 hypothetical protein BO80DRAFT_441959 [Aspergillus ibericus CBS 121593]
MQVYLSLPVFQALIASLEHNPTNEDAIRALAGGFMAYYFPRRRRWIIPPPDSQGNAMGDFVALRFFGERPSFDHIVVKVLRNDDGLVPALNHLQTLMEPMCPRYDNCWAIFFHGLHVRFYEYNGNFPVGRRLSPLRPASEPLRNTFHVRNDSAIVHELMRLIDDQLIPRPRPAIRPMNGS